MSDFTVRSLENVLMGNEPLPPSEWQMKVILDEECFSYFVWNTETREAILIDPKERIDQQGGECASAAFYFEFKESVLKDYLVVAVIDTHTHADHVSAAAEMTKKFNCPLIMSGEAPSKRIQLRVMEDTSLVTHAETIRFVKTPGHTQDAMCVIWGPFVFTGDTVLCGDVGRDDLPGGDAENHYESVQKLKQVLKPETILCPGHDINKGMISSWGTQLKVNPALTQSREVFVKECSEYNGPAPKYLKTSLYENLR